MGRDERVDHDGYAEQEPDDVARQLTVAAQLFANVLGRLQPTSHRQLWTSAASYAGFDGGGPQSASAGDLASVVPVVSADSEPGPVLADDLLQLGGVLRQARDIPDQHEIRVAGCDVGQDLLAPT